MKHFLCVLTTVVSFAVHAQTYPSHAVSVVVPYAPGSSTDVVGREVARALSEGLHQSFVVENRPGAQGTIGAAYVARAQPDGYTLLMGSNTTIAAAPFLFKKIPYSPLTDLLPVARIGAVPFVLVVRPDLPVKTTSDLIAYAHKNPGKLSWGYANAANQSAAAMMTYKSEMNAVAVSYTSVPQIVVDMLGDRLDFAIIDVTNAAPQISAGKLRALAVTSRTALQQLPDVPPLGETLPGYELIGWHGVYVPAKTPKAIIETLAKVLLEGMDTSDTKARLASAGLIFYPAGPDEFAVFGENDTKRWSEMVKAANIEPM